MRYQQALRASRYLLKLCLAAFLSTIGLTAAAQTLSLDRIEPVAVSLGSQTRVVAHGKLPTWPAEVFCDRSDLMVRCGEKSGELDVDLSRATAPGVAWIRLADFENGATNLFPLLIEACEVVAEQEPNNSISDDRVYSSATTLVGKLDKRDDLDCFCVDLSRGETLHARLIGKQVLNSKMDAVMQIADVQGNVLVQSDDEVGVDPQLVFAAERDIRICIRVFAFPETPDSTIGFAGSEDYLYALRLSVAPMVDHFLPLVGDADFTIASNSSHGYGWGSPTEQVKLLPATHVSPRIVYTNRAWQWQPQMTAACTPVVELESSAISPTVVDLPASFSGHIAAIGQVDGFTFRAKKDVKLRAQVHAREFGFPLDSVLQIVEPSSGRVVARNDDASNIKYDAGLDFTIEQDAELELQISDLAESASRRHAYTVQVAAVAPQVELRASNDHYAIQPSMSLELPVSILRQDGFNDELSIVAIDLPAGVTCEPVASKPGDDTSKQVVLKLLADQNAVAAHAMFRIMATRVDSPDNKETLPAISWNAGYPLRPQVTVIHFWLTTTKD